MRERFHIGSWLLILAVTWFCGVLVQPASAAESEVSSNPAVTARLISTEDGKKRLADDTARAANSNEVKDLRRACRGSKKIVAKQALELWLLNKSVLEPSRLKASHSPVRK